MSAVTLIRKAGRNGIVHPVLAYRATRKAPIPFPVACALLEQESAGGRNVWGHDPTWMVGYPVLDEATYKVYKAHRVRFGAQGVGPTQLTWGGYQDRADELGGCWKPWPNMLVGFGIIADHLEAGLTLHEAFARYNGSEAYADQMDARVAKWRDILK